MCYTGKCKYEIIGGDHWGDCSLPNRNYLAERYPEDAHCITIEKEMDLIELPAVTGALTIDATTHLAKTSPLLYHGISEGMITDVDIILKYAREVYQR